ncbi:MAG TPA: ankyrin repeat domain-containing protein [Novosphingobium sp.]|nr:ankyrin repeat domain-containing protein [Novosphingobium sp.]
MNATRFSRVARPLLAAALGVMMAMPNPAAAQFTKAYKFLESVKKKEGQEVTDALSEPGSQLVNTQDVTSGDTALHIVTARRDGTWISFLLAKGADPNIHNNRGDTPLVLAANLGFLEGVQLLVAGGARVDETGPTGETPLIGAVHRRDIPLLRALLKAGADPDRTDSSGRSARDYAKLDRNDNMLTEINANTKPKAAGGGRVYGPTF